MPGSTYSQDTIEEEKRAAQQTSPQLLHGCIAGFVGAVFILISFASPYWLVSWEDTQSPFANMGLLEFCFNRFRFPKFQFDHVFDGCSSNYGDEYRLIREWLMPVWLMFVQLMAFMCFCTSFLSQLVDVALLLRWPMEHVLRFEMNLVFLTFVMKVVVSVLLFLMMVVFGACCWDREWLLYPNFNYLSWSYAMAGFAMLINLASAYFFFLEVSDARDRKEKNTALLMQMYPPAQQSFGGSLSTYHGSHGSQFI